MGIIGRYVVNNNFPLELRKKQVTLTVTFRIKFIDFYCTVTQIKCNNSGYLPMKFPSQTTRASLCSCVKCKKFQINLEKAH